MRYPQLITLIIILLAQSVWPSFAETTTRAKASPTAVHAVNSVAADQAGYVHYFRITHPDNTLEDQVGVELDDQRIAWSFPGVGVIVSEFVKDGPLHVAGVTYRIEHLHGLRPLKSERDMQLLRRDLTRRVAFWVDDETPYCVFRQPGEPFCLNCGDFVARIIYPGTNPLMVGLPNDFIRTLSKMPTADDLLIYMLGLHNLPDASSRIAQLANMEMPNSLRTDVLEMLQPGSTAISSAETAAAANAANQRKPLSRIATRKPQNRRL